jgi:endoglycosylceramidase
MSRSLLALALLTTSACSTAEPSPSPGASFAPPPCAEPRFAKGRIGVQCERLVDAEGRVVLLHGVNARVQGVFDVTFDDGRTELETIPDFDATDAARARRMGFNALRLPINWSALEPKDGAGFDDAYLDRVAAVVKLAGDAGLRVLVDFHQDAYSKEIGEDGAPLWAIVPAPAMLLEGPLDDLAARRISNGVQAAFATFFGPDGAALRTRFAKAVAHVAKRFAGDDNVAGIEAFNEPVSKTPYLDQLHDEVITAVRAVDADRLVFFEPDVDRNLSDHAPPAKRAPWPGTVYSPHVYTLSFDGSPAQRAALSEADLRPSNEAAVKEAATWKAPLAITEFGYGPADVNADLYLELQTKLQDELFASGFFWLWKEQSQGAWGLYDYDAAKKTWTERDHVRKALARVVPEAIGGWPKSLAYDRATSTMRLVFEADAAITAPTRVFVPEEIATPKATCDGKAVSAVVDAKTGVLEVACAGAGEHTIVVGQ